MSVSQAKQAAGRNGQLCCCVPVVCAVCTCNCCCLLSLSLLLFLHIKFVYIFFQPSVRATHVVGTRWWCCCADAFLSPVDSYLHICM